MVDDLRSAPKAPVNRLLGLHARRFSEVQDNSRAREAPSPRLSCGCARATTPSSEGKAPLPTMRSRSGRPCIRTLRDARDAIG